MAMHPGPYFIGTTIKLDALYQDEDNAYTNPTTVTFRLIKPDGTEASSTYGDGDSITRASTGVYYTTVTPTLGGRHYFRWETTDPETAKEGNFIVQRSPHFDPGMGAYR